MLVCTDGTPTFLNHGLFSRLPHPDLQSYVKRRILAFCVEAIQIEHPQQTADNDCPENSYTNDMATALHISLQQQHCVILLGTSWTWSFT